MLDQIMSIAADHSTKSYQILDVVSQNMANYNTWGYKAVRFEQFVRPDGNMDQVRRVDFTPAPTRVTRRELDIALNGSGFIQVTRPDGSTAYTRNGSMAKNAQGFLVTPHGDLVGTGIQVPANYYQMKIDHDGTVSLIDKKGMQPRPIGHITVVNFANPEGLKNIGNNLYAATNDSGEPIKLANHTLIQQGHLEQSNINLNYAVEDILRLNAGVIANLRVVKAVDTIYGEAVQLKQ